MRATAIFLLAAVWDNCEIDQVPHSMKAIPPCVRADAGDTIDVAVEAFDNNDQPLDNVPLDWVLLPSEAGLAEPADAGFHDGGPAVAGLTLIGHDERTRTQAIDDVVSPGIGKATLSVASSPRETDSVLLVTATAADTARTEILIPRDGFRCVSSDGGIR